jgi:RNA polymerase sigma factor (sigma-70 family)
VTTIQFSVTVTVEPEYYASYSEYAMQQSELYISWFCRNYFIPNWEMDDLAQELRLHLWKKLDRYDPAKSTFKSWSKRILRNKVIDLIRTANKQGHDFLDNPNRCYPTIENIQPNYFELEEVYS